MKSCLHVQLILCILVLAFAVGHADTTKQPPVRGEWGGSAARNNVVEKADIPTEWSIGSWDDKTKTWDSADAENVRWVMPLGSVTYGTPIVAGGRVFCATNNGAGYLKKYPKETDLGVLLAFDEKTGKFLWQHSVEKHPDGREIDWPEQGICSNPLVVGDRLWIVTNRAEVVCLATAGDPKRPGESKVLWSFDMIGQLDIHPHNMASCTVVEVGDQLFLCTSNGVNESHQQVPKPKAPSFISLDKNTGKLLWSDVGPGAQILHGQWSSPAVATIDGTTQVIFPAGDGWVYSYEIKKDGPKLLWRFDCNPKDAFWKGSGMGDRASLVSTPVVVGKHVYIATGHDPEFGEANGRLWCIDATRRGDVSPTLALDSQGKPLPPKRLQAADPKKGDKIQPNPNSAAVWCYEGKEVDKGVEREFEEQMHRSISTVVVSRGLVVTADIAGLVHCVDQKTGKLLWIYDAMASIWGSPLVIGDKIYLGDEDGDLIVLRLARTLEEIAENCMDETIYTTPTCAGNTLFIATRTYLAAIGAKK
ncbi:MAG: PQQ-binding-like beta-propeller repeat protein [Planctomycetia bacterium]|jgi:outer membrane protein assembly factor BamB